MTQLFEVRLVRAPKNQVWKTVSDLNQAFLDGEVKVKGTGKGATRTIELGKTTREEKVAELRENDAIVFEVNDGKAEGRIEIALEDHELGTMIVHRAALDGVGAFGKGRYQKELRKRLDAIQAAVEE